MNNSLWLSTLKQSLYRHLTKRSRSHRNRRSLQNAGSVPALVSHTKGETLEDRLLLTTFTVTNNDDSGTGSLRAALEAANSSAGADTITFDASLAGQTIFLSEELAISDDVTIVGLGADLLTISGNEANRLFYINDYQENKLSVAMSGLRLADGYGDFNGPHHLSDGGAIFSYESLSLQDCVFTNNEAVVEGGAIRSSGDLTVIDCTFTGNTTGYYGGAIYNLIGALTVSNSSFDTNTSRHGGAIYNYGSSADLSINNSVFSENVAETNGGAIENESNSVLITGSEFVENSARDGAAVFNKKVTFSNSIATMTVLDTVFTGNTATSSGGGIKNTDASLTVTNSSFQNNSGFAAGGGGIDHSTGQLLIQSSTFTGNSTNADGGGVSIYSEAIVDVEESHLIADTLFTENTANKNGGAISSLNGILTIQNSHITGNSASVNGGGVNSFDTNVTILNTAMSMNTAGKDGGAILSTFDDHLRIENSTISGNQAISFGGGIAIKSGHSTILQSIISGNTSSGSGGGISYNSSNGQDTPTILNSTITGNSATQNGGGIYGFFTGDIEIQNSIVAGNSAGSGAQLYENFVGEFTGSHNVIQDSIAGVLDPVLRDNGGAVLTHALLTDSPAINAGDNSAIQSTGLLLDQRGLGYPRIVGGTVDAGASEYLGSHFLVDSATDTDDGDYTAGNLSLREAIKLANESAAADLITFDASLFDQTLMIYNELVISDDVTIFGHGAEHLTLSGDGTRRLFRIDDGDAENSISVELSGFTLTNGFAHYTSGGAIHSLETLSVSDVTFVDNQASVLNSSTPYGGSYGGAIYSAGDLTVMNSTFVRNSADWYGGAIYSTDGLLSVTGCDFTENQTFYSGGAILVQDGDLHVSSSTFSENHSDTLGGGIYVRNGVLTVDDTVFTENSSGTGGGIYHFNSTALTPVFTELSITDCTFQGNTTTSHGGAVSFGSDLSLYSSYFTAFIENSHFWENSASSGGAIASGGRNVLVSGSTFVKNTARLYGGGINDNSLNLTVQNSLFDQNSADAWGGAIYSNWKLVLQNSTLSGNTALVVGGGIAFGTTGAEFVIINSTLTGNAAAKIGGGIYSLGSVTSMIRNSIIAGNSAPSIPQALPYYTKYNTILQNSVEGLLDPVLRDNGGLMKTHALLPGSAAIDAGDDEALGNVNSFIINRRETTHDLRGTGFERYQGAAIDIGAFEVQSPLSRIELTLVDSRTTTDSNGEIASLPDNLDWVDEWSGYWLEIWIDTPTITDLGILSASLNLSYNTAITSAISIEYGAGFTVNQTGVIDDLTGSITNLSAETDLTDLGADQRVLFARIRFESTADDGIDLDLAGQTLLAQSPEFTLEQTVIELTGGLATEEVQGAAPETRVFANPYDLNDDDNINFRDLILFASVYRTSPREADSGFSWFADLDQSHYVGFRDLIFFTSNYGKSKAGHAEIIYPTNFSTAWNRHLAVESELLPQVNPRSLEQAAAETVLAAVVDSLEPQLTTEENDKLAQVNLEIVDLPEGVLSNTVHDTIYIDINAAGYGWFVDQTPDDNSEFYATGPYTLIAAPYGNSAARGFVDLRTVILHELGHLLGYEHDGAADVMQATLAPGVRYLPDWESATDEFFGSLADNTELSPF
ncbi:choice-of-anchor Q domain-containing protein [Gimesia chilikensis]|uniref:choice-of-anchor Q domain-containing protein n=1 Tax=Gimesia chilikensis TaxID=2605989 RepID=UPI0016597AA0|nr:choice-of-anchor Q domain-containing protein [Gimesia chilikensis]